MVDKSYYVSTGNSDVLGPFAGLDLPEKVVSGEIPKSAVVCEVGLQDWQPIRSVLPDWVLQSSSPVYDIVPTAQEYIPRAMPLRSGNVHYASPMQVVPFIPGGVNPASVALYTSQAKSVPLAILLGILLPGGGYWISGNYLSAVLSLFIIPCLWLLFPVGPIVQILAAIEAALRAKRKNAELARMLGLPPV